jgi:N-acetylmuramoyl-L-alanine amidase
MRLVQPSIFFVLAALLCWPVLGFGGEPLRVLFADNPGMVRTVRAIEQDDLLLMSLDDMAAIHGLSLFLNTEAEKLEVRRNGETLVATAGNPFIVATDATGRRSVHQLPVDVALVSGSYFVPLSSLLPLFDRVSGRSSSFDRRNRSILVRGLSPTAEFDIPDLSFEPKANGLVIRVRASRKLSDFESWLRQDGWLYVTIADARADTNAINRMKPGGMVSRIVAIQTPTSVQLTFRLSGKVATTEILRDDQSDDILVSIRRPGEEDKVLLEKKRTEIQQGLEQQRERWKLDVIVVDAGHGGHDSGTIGVGKTKEKDITLKIAMRLGNMLEKEMKDVKVVYTRKSDKFVELDRRGQIANENDGKLFVSIHCNSLKRKPSPTRGFEVYLLRPGRTQEAIDIAERENAVIELEEGYQERYQELTEENFILVTMAQSAYLKSSEVFADILQQEMEDHLPIPNRGIRQAGFYVLVGAAMPKVLVETAYLSNREDERFLNSSQGQEKIARALFSAIERYKDEYEKLLEEGKEMGVR